MVRRVRFALVFMALLGVVAGTASGGPPIEEKPRASAWRTSILRKKVRWEWPDGRERVRTPYRSRSRPSPLRYPDEPEVLPLILDFGANAPGLEAQIFIPNPAAVEAAGLGYEAFEAGDYARAKASYSEAIQLDPEEPAHYANRAKVRLHLGESTAAIEDLSQAIQVSTRAPDKGSKASAEYYGRPRARLVLPR